MKKKLKKKKLKKQLKKQFKTVKSSQTFVANNHHQTFNLKTVFKTLAIQVEANKYNNLLKMLNNFKEYTTEMKAGGKKKYPNWGVIIKTDFFLWIKKNFNLTNGEKQDFLNKCEQINQNQEISKYIIDKIVNTNLSQRAISKSTKVLGLNVSWDTVNKIALSIFNDSEYEARFSRVPFKIQEKIIKTLKTEIKKIKIKSLKKIRWDLGKPVSIGTIQKIAKNLVGKELYKKYWPANKNLISESLQLKITTALLIESNRGKPRSLRLIAKDFFPKASRNIISNIARKIFSDEEFDKKWCQFIPDDVKIEIIKKLRDEAKSENPMPITVIAEGFPVSARSVIRIGKSLFTEENFSEIWSNDDLIRTGFLTHQNINALLTEFFRNRLIDYYSEVTIFSDKRRVDGFLLKNYLRDDLSEIHLNSNRISRLKGFVFEFTNDISIENLTTKIVKYQHSDLMLLIISTNKWLKSLTRKVPKDNDIIHRNNVRVIRYDLFMRLIGLDTDYMKRFLNIIDLNSTNDIKHLKKLLTPKVRLNKNHELSKNLKKTFIPYKKRKYKIWRLRP